MENQSFNGELLDYLYDEMTPDEKEAFERKLEDDPSLKKEYEELVSAKKELENLKDKEVMEPFSAWGKSTGRSWFQPGQGKRLVVFRPITAIAASLVILMLVGFLTDFSLSVNSQGFQMGFGNLTNTKGTEYLSKEEVQHLIEQELFDHNQTLAAQQAKTNDRYKEQLVAFERTLNQLKDERSRSEVSREDMQEFLQQTESNNAEMMREYLQMTSNQQQKYFKEMFTQFNNFYRQQRENDLAIIQESLLELNQQQIVQKQETDQALASLYTRVKNTN